MGNFLIYKPTLVLHCQLVWPIDYRLWLACVGLLAVHLYSECTLPSIKEMMVRLTDKSCYLLIMTIATCGGRTNGCCQAMCLRVSLCTLQYALSVFCCNNAALMLGIAHYILLEWSMSTLTAVYRASVWVPLHLCVSNNPSLVLCDDLSYYIFIQIYHAIMIHLYLALLGCNSQPTVHPISTYLWPFKACDGAL